jgi:hypothetical protein
MTAMTPITAVIALLTCIAVCMGSYGRALGVIIASTLLWPEYLRIPIGLSQMSAPRLAAIVLVVRIVIRSRDLRFRWKLIDTFVVCGWSWTLIASVIAGSEQYHITYLIGTFFDTVLMYFTARLAMNSWSDFRALFWPLAVVAVWLGFMGMVEATTFSSPYRDLQRYATWSWFSLEKEYRLGLLRATGSTNHPIYFGVAMAIVAGFLFSLRGLVRSSLLVVPFVVMAILGSLSSLSSGPFVTLALLLICNSLHYARSMVKPMLWAVLLISILAEFTSNRHFWYLIDYIALNQGTSWYRSKLFEVAIMQWREWWVVGVGSSDLAHWGPLVDGRRHVDLVNNYVIVATRGGAGAIFFYVGAKVLAFRGYVASSASLPKPARSMGFALSSTLIALSIGEMSVGFFGPALIFNYMLLGLLVQISFVGSTVLDEEHALQHDDGHLLR